MIWIKSDKACDGSLRNWPIRAGKSFFLNLCKMAALQKKLVVAQADLTLDRRLHGNGGQARRLYAALMQNLAIKAKPEGGALSSIVEGWISDLQHEVENRPAPTMPKSHRKSMLD